MLLCLVITTLERLNVSEKRKYLWRISHYCKNWKYLYVLFHFLSIGFFCLDFFENVYVEHENMVQMKDDFKHWKTLFMSLLSLDLHVLKWHEQYWKATNFLISEAQILILYLLKCKYFPVIGLLARNNSIIGTFVTK